MAKSDLIDFKLHGIRALVTGSASGLAWRRLNDLLGAAPTLR